MAVSERSFQDGVALPAAVGQFHVVPRVGKTQNDDHFFEAVFAAVRQSRMGRLEVPGTGGIFGPVVRFVQKIFRVPFYQYLHVPNVSRKLSNKIGWQWEFSSIPLLNRPSFNWQGEMRNWLLLGATNSEGARKRMA